MESYDQRLKYSANILNSTIKIGIENIVQMAKRFHTKLLVAEKYCPSKEISCRTILFRAETSSEFSETIGHDYGLSKVRFDFVEGKTTRI